jgi:hypothetical protein
MFRVLQRDRMYDFTSDPLESFSVSLETDAG